MRFSLPGCYFLLDQPELIRPDTKKLSLFSEDILFYIFYSMPGDIMQSVAATELQTREWYFHKDNKIWVKKVLDQMTNGYVYFDIDQWQSFPVGQHIFIDIRDLHDNFKENKDNVS